MRANKLILLSSILFGFILLFGCEGSEGPQGEQGPEGPQGPAGNANVLFTFLMVTISAHIPFILMQTVFYLISKVNPMQLKISGNII